MPARLRRAELSTVPRWQQSPPGTLTPWGINHRSDLVPQPGELAIGLPYLFQIHSVIGVDQQVTHACHCPPGNLRMAVAAVLAQALGCFA